MDNNPFEDDPDGVSQIEDRQDPPFEKETLMEYPPDTNPAGPPTVVHHAHDTMWTFIFVFTTVGYLIMTVFGVIYMPQPETQIRDAPGDSFVRSVFITVAVVAGFLLCYCGCAMFLLKRYTTHFLISVLVVNLIATFSSTVLFFVFGYTFWGVFSVVYLLVVIYLAYTFRNQIDLANHMMRLQVTVIEKHPSILLVSVVSCVPQFIISVLWMCAAIVNWITFGWPSVIYSMLIICWVSAVVSNTVSVTTMQVWIGWYFGQEVDVCRFLRKSVTTHFGTVACSSVISSFGTIVSVGLGMCQFCCQTVIGYINKYVLIGSVLYGTDFCDGSTRVSALFETRGRLLFSAINDYLVNTLMGLCNVIGGFLCGVVIMIMSVALNPFAEGTDEYTGYNIWMAFLGFTICYTIISKISQVIEAGVSTTFICFVVRPEGLQELDYRLYGEFRAAFCTLAPGLFETEMV